jgi:hypothetical protein
MQKLSNNVVHGQNLTVMSGAVEFGTELFLRALNAEASATTLNGEFLTIEDIKQAIATRFASQKGI